MKNKTLSHCFLALSIGLVYLWFGLLKFFPGLSPAENLANLTISKLTFELLSPQISLLILACIETLIGLSLILNICRKQVIMIALIHMLFTFTPFFLFPEKSFVNGPFQFTLLGQYIFKNVIIIGALLTLAKKSTYFLKSK